MNSLPSSFLVSILAILRPVSKVFDEHFPRRLTPIPTIQRRRPKPGGHPHRPHGHLAKADEGGRDIGPCDRRFVGYAARMPLDPEKSSDCSVFRNAGLDDRVLEDIRCVLRLLLPFLPFSSSFVALYFPLNEWTNELTANAGAINIPNLAQPYSAVCSGLTGLLFSGLISVGVSLMGTYPPSLFPSLSLCVLSCFPSFSSSHLPFFSRSILSYQPTGRMLMIEH